MLHAIPQIDITIETQEIQIAKIAISIIEGLQCFNPGAEFKDAGAVLIVNCPSLLGGPLLRRGAVVVGHGD